MLEDAFRAAQQRHEKLMGASYVFTPRLEIVKDDGFWALVEAEGDGFTLRISTGTARRALEIAQAGGDAFSQSRPGANEIAHVSLIWLMLHEIEHIDMGHFDLIGRSAMTETATARQFALVRPASIVPSPAWDDRIKDKLDRCLELQADHNAIELILEAYSTDGWEDLLVRIVAIATMMILIEKHDAETAGESGASHPRAATRMFQLLGHVAEMWQLPERMRALKEGRPPDPARMPEREEIAAFQAKVVLPAFTIAKKLAEASEACAISDDLGSEDAFFRDVARAQRLDGEHEGAFQTAGAKEWHDLWDANLLILEQLPELGLTVERSQELTRGAMQ